MVVLEESDIDLSHKEKRMFHKPNATFPDGEDDVFQVSLVPGGAKDNFVFLIGCSGKFIFKLFYYFYITNY